MKNSCIFNYLILVLLPAALIGLASPGAASASQFVTIGTGGVTGVYYPVGRAICRLINQNRNTHGVRCAVESTGASVFNVTALRSGALNLSFVQGDVQYYAYTGTGAISFSKAGPSKELRVLFSLESEAFTLVARDDADIDDFEDLIGKRLTLGDPGSGNRNTLELLMKEYGWTRADFPQTSELQPAEMARALCDNIIDAYVYVVAHPNDSLKEASACKSHIVPIVGQKVNALMKKYPFYPAVVIPGGMYAGTQKDIKTFGTRTGLLVTTHMSEETAYQITKAIFDNFEEFRKSHPSLDALTPKKMLTGNSVPYHPGAIRYFKETGMMK